MRAQFRFRIRIVLGVIVLIACIIVVRLYFIQIVSGEEYALKADRQFASGGSSLFDRGSIYFTRKEGTLVSAATLHSGFLVAINPQTLTDPERAYREITSVASSTLSPEAFRLAVAREGQVYIEVAHHIRDEEGKQLAAKEIPGVQVLRERWRTYPGLSLASESIGIVSYGSGDTLAGQTGLEAFYDETLSRSGDPLYKNFFAELFSNVGDLLVNARDTHEGDIITTIEPEVETRLYNDVKKVNTRYASRESGGIIMDPLTGALIAIARYPTYNGNDLSRVNPSLLTNPFVEHVYEFGSIMKPLTMAAALDSGVVTPESTYRDTGCITVNTEQICNWDQKARGTISMGEIIKQSLNVGAAYLATEMGQSTFREYFTTLFGKKTGVDVPGETGALLKNLSKREQVGYDTAAFGQGIAVTPIAMARALATVANGGYLVSPHFVSAIRLNSGVVRTLTWDERVKVFSATSTRDVTEMMVAVVDEKIANGTAKIPTLSVAAKTGTAQLVLPGGGYSTDRFFHSFVGFFPAYNPRFIILLYTHDPRGVQYASETLVPTFLDLVHFLVDYYAVPPDRGLTFAQ